MPAPPGYRYEGGRLRRVERSYAKPVTAEQAAWYHWLRRHGERKWRAAMAVGITQGQAQRLDRIRRKEAA